MKLGENWRELGKYFHQFDLRDRSRAGCRHYLVRAVALAEPAADRVSSPANISDLLWHPSIPSVMLSLRSIWREANVPFSEVWQYALDPSGLKSLRMTP